MAAKPANTHPKKALSLRGLTADEALAAFLRVKPADLKRMEAQEKKAKPARRKAR